MHSIALIIFNEFSIEFCNEIIPYQKIQHVYTVKCWNKGIENIIKYSENPTMGPKYHEV